MKDVNKEPWFHGRITREEAEDVLDRGGCIDGQFLVRESTNLAGEYALSLCFRGNKYHYHITRHGDSRVAIEDGQRFEGPVELVAHHFQSQDGLLTRLKKALHRSPGVPPRGYRGVSHEEMQAARMNAVANLGFPVSHFQHTGVTRVDSELSLKCPSVTMNCWYRSRSVSADWQRDQSCRRVCGGCVNVCAWYSCVIDGSVVQAVATRQFTLVQRVCSTCGQSLHVQEVVPSLVRPFWDWGPMYWANVGCHGQNG